MSQGLILDTDVLIDYLRGRVDAVTYIEGVAEPLFMSTVTLAELYAGVREGPERKVLDTFVSSFQLVGLDSSIAVQGGVFRRDYRKSHNVGLADALIAATAAACDVTLVTLNQKHFPMLETVIVPYVKT